MITSVRKWMVAGVVTAMVAAPALADKSYLMGTLRDFTDTHPDFEHTDDGTFGTVGDMVLPNLGLDGTPILNVQPAGFFRVYVESENYELSNVVLHLVSLDDEALEAEYEYKFDDLSVGKSESFDVPAEYEGYTIQAVWVKAGNNSSGDGPGYGDYVELDSDYLDETHTVTRIVDEGTDKENTITAQFYYDNGIPDIWRIDSVESFYDWFHCDTDANMTTFELLEMDNGDTRPGGIYTFDRSLYGNGPYSPLDGRLFGADDPNSRNGHFTLSLEGSFTYDPNLPMDLSFSGQDDLWVFVNGQLIVDIGGVKDASQEGSADVNLHDLASQLGLEAGKKYSFHLFFADRQSPDGYLLFEVSFPFDPPNGD